MTNNLPMWKHQEYTVKLAQIERDVAMFFEQGTGKTRTMIEILRRQYAQVNGIKKTLIFSLPKVCPQWKDEEFHKYSKIPKSEIIVLGGSQKKRVRDFIKAVGEDLTQPKIILTNYESLLMKDLYKLLLQWCPEVVVYDEAHKLKNPQAKKAKAAVPLSDRATHRYTLTGTPVLSNHGMDLFMQFRILDEGNTFGKNFKAFKMKYFFDANSGMSKESYFPDWRPRETTFQEMQKLIMKKSVRVLKKDCLDLPPLIKQVRLIELSKEQQKAYKEMYNDYITWVKDKSGENRASVARLAVTKSLRLQQIVSGFVKDEDGTVHRLPCPRLEDLRELLETITPTSKVIVWAAFHENYTDLGKVCDDLGIKYCELHGEVTHKQGLESIQEFRNNPEVRVLISHPKSGGAGLNLVEAGYSIYYSKTWSLEDELQSESRNHRGGSEIHSQIIRIDLMAKGTIDEVINEALADKNATANTILGWTERMKLNVDSDEG